MFRASAVVVALVLGLAACSPEPTARSEVPSLLTRLAEEGCPVPDQMASPEWEEVRGSAFRFRLPEGFTQVVVQPIDSETALFVSSSGHITYDFGPYSSGFVGASVEGRMIIAECETTIGGRTAQLGLFRDFGELRVAAWWPELGDGLIGPDHLSLGGFAKDPATANALLATALSVQPL
ncbi:MAG: hypothetical protein ABFS34_14715 [Gemmatimonadota bacterium]